MCHADLVGSVAEGIAVVRWTARAVSVLMAGVAGLLVTALTLGALGPSLAREAGSAVTVRLDLPSAADLSQLEQRSVVLAPDGTPMATFHAGINRHTTALEDLPDHVWQAVLAAEDRRFFEHGGYDVEAIARAALANARAGTVVQGGSTLTQQLAKTVVGDDRTLRRKLAELRQALALERDLTKEELLATYLDLVYLGSGAYGVGAAAEEYFAVSAEELTVEQSALLAGIIRSPSALDPRVAPEAALERRNVVLASMAEQGWLTDAEAAALREEPLGVSETRSEALADPHVIESVRRELTCDPEATGGQRWPTCDAGLARAGGPDSSARLDRLYTGGLEVTTTVDPALQATANDLIRERFPEPGGVTAAIVALDPRDGRVLVAASGRGFDEDEQHLPLQGRRQPGSAFKPLVMAAALEEGVAPGTRLEGDSGTTFGEDELDPDETWRTVGVRNFGDRDHDDPTMHEALTDSVNTAFADLILQVGAGEVREVAERLGVDEGAFVGAAGPEANPSMALGGLATGTTPLELATALGAITQGGAVATPHLVAEVADAEGRVRYAADHALVPVLDDEVADDVTGALLAAVERGTGTAAQLPGWDVAGKTGTTQEQRDVWFVGATPTLVTAVWIGHPSESVTLTSATSSGTAAPLWRDFMEQALEGEDPQRFDGISSEGPEPEPREREERRSPLDLPPRRAEEPAPLPVADDEDTEDAPSAGDEQGDDAADASDDAPGDGGDDGAPRDEDAGDDASGATGGAADPDP